MSKQAEALVAKIEKVVAWYHYNTGAVADAVGVSQADYFMLEDELPVRERAIYEKRLGIEIVPSRHLEDGTAVPFRKLDWAFPGFEQRIKEVSE